MAKAIVRAAVRVVFPWSTWPIVPILTWGFFLSNLPLAALTVNRPRRRVVEEGDWRKRVEGVAIKDEDKISLLDFTGFEIQLEVRAAGFEDGV